MSIDVTMSGPLFDGRAQRAADRYCEDARDRVAEFGEEIALREMGMSFRNPTGYYESRVTTTNVTSDTARVHDQGVIYGPWLEGVGSMNFPVTRFRGYWHWRKAKQAVAERGRDIAEQVLAQHIGGMR